METLKTVYEQLEIIKKTSSKIKKEELIKKYAKDDTFKTVLVFAYNPYMQYKIKKIPKEKVISEFSINNIFTFLTTLSNKKGATNEDYYKLGSLCNIDDETYNVIHRVVNKDLKCGFSAKTINKAIPYCIPVVPYMRCSNEKKLKHIDYPAIVQEKADGVFVNVIIDNNNGNGIKVVTRNGKEVHQLNHLKHLFNTELDGVFMGELVVIENNILILSRKKGNGIINSCLHGTCSPVDSAKIRILVWDVIPLINFYDGIPCNIPYIERFNQCRNTVKKIKHRFIKTIKTKKVNNIDEAREFYTLMRSEGKEGAVLKNYNLIWKNHTSNDQIKLKNEMDVELKIVDIQAGKEGTKYEDCLGALLCESKCGSLKVSVGSGFTDKERHQDWQARINRIITVTCESVITDKKKSTSSLFLPRFKELREDKDIADTLQEILER